MKRKIKFNLKILSKLLHRNLLLLNIIYLSAGGKLIPLIQDGDIIAKAR